MPACRTGATAPPTKFGPETRHLSPEAAAILPDCPVFYQSYGKATSQLLSGGSVFARRQLTAGAEGPASKLSRIGLGNYLPSRVAGRFCPCGKTVVHRGWSLWRLFPMNTVLLPLDPAPKDARWHTGLLIKRCRKRVPHVFVRSWLCRTGRRNASSRNRKTEPWRRSAIFRGWAGTTNRNRNEQP